LTRRVLCVDVGSTFTKVAFVDADDGTLLATGSCPTTLDTDVMDGYLAVREQVGGGQGEDVLVCSSAGGGLRLAVVGYERAITAEAGQRVGLTAGARVEHVSAGRMDGAGVAALLAARPDVVLLVGGTDGGNAEVLLHNAGALARSRVRCPIVVAGNVAVRDEVCAMLRDRGKAVLPTDNVLPEIGTLAPGPARTAIREVFVRHVIGGKHLSRDPAFAAMVRAATPDAVLMGVERLAELVGDVVVVDVGGATTDVYSVLRPDAERVALRGEVVDVLPGSRTVEGDLGVRWNADSLLDAAVSERLLGEGEVPALRAAAARRVGDPAYVPDSPVEAASDLRLAELALTVALRRHARPAPGSPGRDLRGVRLVVGSGGVLRHADPAAALDALRPALGDHAGGWRVPERARLAVDGRYVLAAAGLLSLHRSDAAGRLVARYLAGPTGSPGKVAAY